MVYGIVLWIEGNIIGLFVKGVVGNVNGICCFWYNVYLLFMVVVVIYMDLVIFVFEFFERFYWVGEDNGGFL